MHLHRKLAAIIDTFPLRFFRFKKKKLDANALFGTFTHRKNRYDIKARVTSTTYYSQLSKCSHLQLVSWVAKTRMNMSRPVANTSHPVNNHYNSNPDTFWTNHVRAAVMHNIWYTPHVHSGIHKDMVMWTGLMWFKTMSNGKNFLSSRDSITFWWKATDCTVSCSKLDIIWLEDVI